MAFHLDDETWARITYDLASAHHLHPVDRGQWSPLSDPSLPGATILRMDAMALNAILKDFPTATIVVEGHCDERGSAEYNLGLGDRLATATREFLQGIGVPADRFRVVSFGKERPQCIDSNEDCWQKPPGPLLRRALRSFRACHDEPADAVILRRKSSVE